MRLAKQLASQAEAEGRLRSSIYKLSSIHFDPHVDNNLTHVAKSLATTSMLHRWVT